jgi:hypothetical protein
LPIRQFVCRLRRPWCRVSYLEGNVENRLSGRPRRQWTQRDPMMHSSHSHHPQQVEVTCPFGGEPRLRSSHDHGSSAVSPSRVIRDAGWSTSPRGVTAMCTAVDTQPADLPELRIVIGGRIWVQAPKLPSFNSPGREQHHLHSFSFSPSDTPPLITRRQGRSATPDNAQRSWHTTVGRNSKRISSW